MLNYQKVIALYPRFGDHRWLSKPREWFSKKKQQRDPALGDVLSLMFHTVEPREADIWGPSSSLPTSRASCGEGP